MKKLLVLMTLMLLLLFSLISCGSDSPEEGETDKPNSETSETPENLIFNESSELYLVYDPEKISQERLDKFTYKFFELGIFPRAVPVGSEQHEHELLLGMTDRKLSQTAYTRMDRMDKNSDEDTRYCFYSDGSSLAIVYDEDCGDFTRDIALDKFLSDYLSAELCLAEGPHEEEMFNLYDRLSENDAAYFEKRWANLSTQLGEGSEELIKALQSYYSLYDGEKIVTWLSNLYDPNICVCKALDGESECKKTKYCGTGGFYYSNSARDNVGYLPDAESIAQAFSILGNCGITYGLPSGGYKGVVPDWMAKKICDYIYNLQESDGFFYHPQWGKDITLSRRGRDLSWCTGVLETYNVPLKYYAPSSASYDLPSETELPTRLGASSVTAVSKVVNTATVEVADHLKTPEAFAAYLESLDIYNKSYSAGNTLSAQGSQIKARGPEYGEILINKLNEVYNYYGNGTWHHTVNYYAINGVMKISGSYGRWNAEIPDGELTCRASFAAIGSDEAVKDVVDIWNPWVAVNNVLGNIKAHSPDPNKANKIRESLYPYITQAIYDTRDKLALFKKDDGSFSYQQTHSSSSSQGAPVAIPGANEGDVNATTIATNNFTYEIFQFLGVSRIQFALTKERLIFLETVNNLPEVQKSGLNSDIGEPIDFDFDDVGYEPFDVTVDAEAEGEGSRAYVDVDPRGEDKGNILRYQSVKGEGDFISITNTGTAVGATCQVFEGEFCFESINNGNELFRFEFGQGGDNINVYRMLTRVNNGKIELYDRSSRDNYPGITNKLGISLDQGEWFKLRVEYYVGDHDSVRIKIYVNDKLAVVTDNYYDYNGVKIDKGVGTPGTKLKNTRLYMLKDCQVTLLCDNLHSYATKDSYKPEALAEEYKNNNNVDSHLLIEEGTEVGKRAPIMELEKIREEGETLSTRDLFGKLVVVNLWGSWDNTCKQQLPVWAKVAGAFEESVYFYSAHSTEYAGMAHGFINNTCPDSKINFVYDVREEGADADTYFSLLGGTDTYPRTLILNERGIILFVKDGAMSEEELTVKLNELLGK